MRSSLTKFGLCQLLCAFAMIGAAMAPVGAQPLDDGAEEARWRWFSEAAEQPLRVAALSLCLEPPQFARCQLPGELRFDRSETLFIYFEPRGLDFQKLDGAVRTAWRQRLSLRDVDGREIWTQAAMIDRDIRRQRPALDVFGANRLQLEGLPSGRYQLVVVVSDRIAKESAEASLEFQVGMVAGETR